jgi:hypothetical protein
MHAESIDLGVNARLQPVFAHDIAIDGAADRVYSHAAKAIEIEDFDLRLSELDSRNMASQGPLCSEAKRGGSHLRRGCGVPARHEEPTTERAPHATMTTEGLLPSSD